MKETVKNKIKQNIKKGSKASQCREGEKVVKEGWNKVRKIRKILKKTMKERNERMWEDEGKAAHITAATLNENCLRR